ncbi:hypothetical protein [Leuconostoc citreum]|uniref:hypothetical protein n=1 Tax=Leuconostoc citreum TaxID=33964 RepID=UPI0032DE9200
MAHKYLKTFAINSNLLDLAHVKYALTSSPLNFEDYFLKLLGQAKLNQANDLTNVHYDIDKVIPVTLQVSEYNWLCDATLTEVNSLLASQLTEFQMDNITDSWFKHKIYPVAKRFLEKTWFFKRRSQVSDDKYLISLKEIVHKKARQHRQFEVLFYLMCSLFTMVLGILLLSRLGSLFSEAIKQTDLTKLFQVFITPLPKTVLVTILFMVLNLLIVKHLWQTQRWQHILVILDIFISSGVLLHYVLLTSLTSFGALQQISRFVLQSIAIFVGMQLILVLSISLVGLTTLDHITLDNVVDLMQNRAVNLKLIYDEGDSRYDVSLNHCQIVKSGIVGNGLLDDTKLIYASLSVTERLLVHLGPAK